ncbi:hypothetical protein CCR96_18280 [Halochromatium roseum]|nr:hypothetical protein [Halochromatium roseum]
MQNRIAQKAMSVYLFVQRIEPSTLPIRCSSASKVAQDLDGLGKLLLIDERIGRAAINAIMLNTK